MKYYKYYMTPLEKEIQKLYERIDVNSPNVQVSELADRLGINLFYYHFSFSVDGSIFLDSSLSMDKQKEVFAHELCHCLYHVGNQLNLPYLFRQFQEYKATNFALHFCIPTFLLLQINIPNYKPHAAAIVAEEFCVTNELALKKLDYIERQLLGSALQFQLIKSIRCFNKGGVYL